jgi:hypothetical protein
MDKQVIQDDKISETLDNHKVSDNKAYKVDDVKKQFLKIVETYFEKG